MRIVKRLGVIKINTFWVASLWNEAKAYCQQQRDGVRKYRWSQYCEWSQLSCMELEEQKTFLALLASLVMQTSFAWQGGGVREYRWSQYYGWRQLSCMELEEHETFLALLASLVVQTSFARQRVGVSKYRWSQYFGWSQLSCMELEEQKTFLALRAKNELRSAEGWSQEVQMELVLWMELVVMNGASRTCKTLMGMLRPAALYFYFTLTLLALLASLVVQTSFARQRDGVKRYRWSQYNYTDLVGNTNFTCTTRFARSANELRSAERWSQEIQMEL